MDTGPQKGQTPVAMHPQRRCRCATPEDSQVLGLTRCQRPPLLHLHTPHLGEFACSKVRPGPDPYVFYKMHHVDRARVAWAVSEDVGLFEALRDGPRTVSEVANHLELTDRSTAALLSANGCLDILGNHDGHWFILPDHARVRP